MKQSCRFWLEIVLFFLLYTLSVSLIPSLLYTHSLISTEIYSLLCLLLGAVLYGLCGIGIGKKVQKKVLLQALVFLAVLLTFTGSLSFYLDEFSLVSVSVRTVVYMVCVLVMISRR